MNALERIYHKDLKIIKIDERDHVTVINREENLAFFRSKLESKAEPLSREAEFIYADAGDRIGHVVVVRRMKLTDRFEKSVFSIRLVWQDAHGYFVDPKERLTVIWLTNTTVAGMTGDFPKALASAVYNK